MTPGASRRSRSFDFSCLRCASIQNRSEIEVIEYSFKTKTNKQKHCCVSVWPGKRCSFLGSGHPSTCTVLGLQGIESRLGEALLKVPFSYACHSSLKDRVLSCHVEVQREQGLRSITSTSLSFHVKMQTTVHVFYVFAKRRSYVCIS